MLSGLQEYQRVEVRKASDVSIYFCRAFTPKATAKKVDRLAAGGRGAKRAAWSLGALASHHDRCSCCCFVRRTTASVVQKHGEHEKKGKEAQNQRHHLTTLDFQFRSHFCAKVWLKCLKIRLNSLQSRRSNFEID